VGDLIIYSVAPAILIFFMFTPFHAIMAFIVGGFFLLCGCLRLARYNVKKIEYPGYFVGLTRPGLAYAVVAFLMSSLWPLVHSDASFIISGMAVMGVSLLNLSFLPYVGHHKRRFSRRQVTGLCAILLIMTLALSLGLFWDAFFVVAVLYLISPLFVPKEDSRRYWKFVKKWRQS
jgi:CDP-diacylglycerol--serine O-phosphatidyltransferase